MYKKRFNKSFKINRQESRDDLKVDYKFQKNPSKKLIDEFEEDNNDNKISDIDSKYLDLQKEFNFNMAEDKKIMEIDEN